VANIDSSPQPSEQDKEKEIREELGIEEDVALGYIPEGAKLNVENSDMDSPETIYEKRRKDIGKDKVGKIVGGQYGNSGD
jgi:hypothetical protein